MAVEHAEEPASIVVLVRRGGGEVPNDGEGVLVGLLEVVRVVPSLGEVCISSSNATAYYSTKGFEGVVKGREGKGREGKGDVGC